MERLLISSCLLGLATRYDGRAKSVFSQADIAKLSKTYELVPVCPEIYGGLPTPRTPSERVGAKVLMKDGTDVTENYRKGAMDALMLCRILGIKKALLKARSPSCGKGEVYDGSFSGTLTAGHGVTAELLVSNGIEVYTENELNKLI